MIRDSQYLVSRSVWQSELSFLNSQRQQSVFIDKVIVIARQCACRIAFFKTADVWNMVSIIIEYVGLTDAFLHQVMNSVKVCNKPGGIVPPSHIRIEMRAGKILLPRHSHFFGRTGERMQINQIKSCAKFMVSRRLHVGPYHVIPMRSDGGERFCAHQFFSVNFSGAGGLFHEKTVCRPGSVRRGRPKFAHYDFTVSVIFQTVERAGMGAGRFRLDSHPEFFGSFPKNSVMFVRYAVADCFSEVG